MVLILAIVFLAIVLTVDVIRRSRAKARPVAHSARTITVQPVTTAIHPIERYFHPGHTWALVEDPQLVTLGVDDFTRHLVGSVEAIDLPDEGYTLYQGQPFVTLRRGSKSISQVSPVSGIVEKVNHRLVFHPSLIDQSPYEKGWLVKLVPTNLRNDLNNLLKGAVAERWEEAVRMQLMRWLAPKRVYSGFAPKLGTVLQDGGELIENISDILTDEEWNLVIREFYPYVVHRTSTNGPRKGVLP